MSNVPRGQTPERQAYMKAWNAAHPRDRSAYKAAYDAIHREEGAAYRAANSERLKAKHEAYYEANRERILARVKAHSEAKRDEILAYQATYYETHTEKVKTRVSAYKAAYPEKRANLENRRRARKAGNGGSHTAQEWSDKCAALGNVCFYCGEAKPLTRDHDIPLKLGGTDDISNILPACRSCNSSKNAKTAAEFSRTNHARIGDERTATRIDDRP